MHLIILWLFLSSIIILMILVIIAVILLPKWISHDSMTEEHSNKYGYSNFKKFKEQFIKYEWTIDDIYTESLFNKEKDCELHANIIRFNGVGMIMKTPLDLWLVDSFIKKYIYNKYGKVKKNYKSKTEGTFDWNLM
jgi:hypothetical protein